jgi:predicted nuclease of predicted toxin-antitoxin system
MKLLLDENLPNKLKFRFRDAQYECYTVQDMDWASLTNGALLEKMIEHSFEVLITMDSNIGFQQNFNNYPIPVLILISKSNTYENIIKSFGQILLELVNLQNGPNTVVIK